MAAAAIVRTYKVKPGRNEEFRTALDENRKVIEATGAKTRAWFSLFAGEAAHRVIEVAEYENHAALGAGVDHLLTLGPLPIQKVLEGDNPAAESLGLSTLSEIQE